MDKHCKGCAYHHNAGHPKGSPYAAKHNDWCTHYSSTASRVIGHCKMKGGKKLRDNAERKK